jgi:hypothetical protein
MKSRDDVAHARSTPQRLEGDGVTVPDERVHAAAVRHESEGRTSLKHGGDELREVCTAQREVTRTRAR